MFDQRYNEAEEVLLWINIFTIKTAMQTLNMKFIKALVHTHQLFLTKAKLASKLTISTLLKLLKK